MSWKIGLFVTGLLFLVSCTPLAASATPSITNSSATPTELIATSEETAASDELVIPTTTLSPTTTATITERTATGTPTQTPIPSATETQVSAQTSFSPVIADHSVVDQFPEISDEFIQAAADLRLMFRGSSIAHNINMGLDCLQGDFGGRRPNYCSDFSSTLYDRSNWDFPARGNPGWIQKVDDFVELVDQNAEQYDVFIFLVDYADGIDNATYPKISEPDNFQERFVMKLEALEARHPDKIIVWTTMSMARTGFDNATAFNQMLREYAVENGKILFDLADIESHSPTGEAQIDDQGREVLYSGYTDETRAGHLNEVGRERVSRSLWWLMARLGGWEGFE